MKVSKRNNIFKKVLFTFIVALLSLPMIQQKMQFIEQEPLKGSFAAAEQPVFSSNDWFEGVFQQAENKYLDQNFGFRNFHVRLYNQIQYSFFNQARANGVIVGKENYLYEKNYIKAHLGRDFIGTDKIEDKVAKLQRIVDTLRTKEIELIVLLAPGKGSYYPEYIPDNFDPQNKSTTNYEVYKEKLAQSDIRLLDFNSWFRKMKSNAPYPLFPKTGIHWSKYGEMLAADSLIKSINTLNAKRKIPELEIGEIEVPDTVRKGDDDIEIGMNLLMDIEDLAMGYARFKLRIDTSLVLPKVLTIADSYYWGMFNWGLSKNGFNKGEFWYYNKQIYPDSYKAPIKVQDIDMIKRVEKNNVIILISTDANLYKFAFGFIDELYENYFGLEVTK